MRETSELVKAPRAAENLSEQQPSNLPLPQSYTPRGGYYYGASDVPEESTGYARLSEYWHSVRKHIWLVLGIIALVTALVAVYMARQADIYEARGRLQVDLEINNPALGGLKSNSIILSAPYQDPTYFNTQLQILTSAGLLTRVIKTLDLEHNQAFLQPRAVQKRSTWDNLLRTFGLGGKDAGREATDGQQPGAQLTTTQQQKSAGALMPANPSDELSEVNRLSPLVDALQAGLTVRQINDTRLIEIRFKHADPEVASKIVNTIGETFVLSNLERKTETGSTAGSFLQQRIAELQSEIRAGEERLNNYAKNNRILSLDPSQNTVVDRLTGLNKQLLEAQNELKLAEAAYRAAQSPGAASALAEGAANKRTEDIEGKLTELRQKRTQLLLEYTEKYPEVKDVNEQIALLERQLNDVKNRATTVVTTNLETNYRQAFTREQALRADFERQRAETLTQNEASVNYRIIQQEIATNRELLDGLLQRSKENEVVVAGTPNNIHVVDYAPKPKSPVGPRRLQAVVIAMLFSIGLGVVVARYLDYLDDTIHTAEESEVTLRLPTLAVIPTIGSLARRRFLPAIGALQKRNNGHIQEELLINNGDGRSPLAESYRQLRTSVLLSSAGGAPKTLLVTSSIPSEGKTTTAVNTAMILEQNGADVLLIDGDMRRPRLHTIFNVENRTGLSTILANRMSEVEMLSLIVQDTNSGLHILPSGPIPPNPAELLGSEQMRSLIAAVEGTFTHVIIDSPPIASFTDGVLISTLVDGVLLVVYGGKTARHIVRRSRQLLQDVGARIFGTVLNNVTLRSDDYYYKYYQHNYYNYSAGADAETAPIVSDAAEIRR